MFFKKKFVFPFITNRSITVYISICLTLSSCNSTSEQNSGQEIQIDKIVSFAKVIGYIKYFHPSDEAANLDWDRYSKYSITKILATKSEEEFINFLDSILLPIAPSATVTKGGNDEKFDLKRIIPADRENYNLTYWQHRGVSRGTNSIPGNDDTYQSTRVNGRTKVDLSDKFGTFTIDIDAKKYIGNEVRFSGLLKMKKNSVGSGHLRLHMVDEEGTTLALQNMRRNPVKSEIWEKYELTQEVDSNTTTITVGFSLKGEGLLYLGNPTLDYKKENKWINIPLGQANFSERNTNMWTHTGKGYISNFQFQDSVRNEKHGIIKFVGTEERSLKEEKLFDAEPKIGEVIYRDIGNNIFCQIPIALYTNGQNTFPKSDYKQIESLQNKLKKQDLTTFDLTTRIANIISVYNIFEHFYPYFDVLEVDWEKVFRSALKSCFTDQTEEDHIITLQKFTSVLQDGHISVLGNYINSKSPPIAWEWIQGRLIITKVLNNDLPISIGDTVTHIDGMEVNDYFKEINSRISAGDTGWLNYKAQLSSLAGEENSTMRIAVGDKTLELIRDSYLYEEPARQSTYEKINDSVIYINLTSMDIASINDIMPTLNDSKSIIFDLRGYPNRNHKILTHLLSVNDTAKSFFKVPNIMYPHRENIVGHESYQWDLKKCDPYLGNKQILFITDGRAISYAESIMAYVKGYKLGKIIGQSTAGANGNFNSMTLIGNIKISWTGMKTVKLDGSRLHGIGIHPDIRLEKTVDGLLLDKDEFLEYAIELTKK